MNKKLLKHVGLLAMVVFLSACGPAATPTQTPEPTPLPSPTPVPTLASLPGGGYVYGDPGGRFSLPLVGHWTPVETDGSHGHFILAEPILDAYVVTVESEDLDAVAKAALAQIGLDPSALSQPAIVPLSRWTAYLYELDSGRGVTLVAQRLGGATIAVVFSGESSVTTAPLAEVFLPTLDRLAPGDLLMVQMSRNPAEVFLTLDGLALMPLADYLEFQPPPAPSTVEDIESLNTIEFYSGRTKLVGRLTLPEGGGPFPAIVYTGWGSGKTTRRQFNPNYMRRAGLAVFSYDKRGGGDSEGVFVEAGLYTGEWRLPQLADDALAAVAFLQGLEEINPDQIGLMGESQNGWTIPLAAASPML